MDECGFNRVRTAQNVLSSKRISDEPFICPFDVEQIFVVEDTLHKGWQLVVPYDARTVPVYYKQPTPADSDMSESENNTMEEDAPSQFETKSRNHNLVANE
jgi:hypothetical protein